MELVDGLRRGDDPGAEAQPVSALPLQRAEGDVSVCSGEAELSPTVVRSRE